TSVSARPVSGTAQTLLDRPGRMDGQFKARLDSPNRSGFCSCRLLDGVHNSVRLTLLINSSLSYLLRSPADDAAMFFSLPGCALSLRAASTRLPGLTRQRPPNVEPGTHRFTYIDALRAIAAIAVLVYHFGGSLTRNFDPKPLPYPLHWLIDHGNLGV